MNILEKIVLHKKNELEDRKKRISLDSLKDQAWFSKPNISVKKRLESGSTQGIIAEFKRHSPSQGDIHLEAPILEIVKGYEHAGAAAVSVLTESEFFKGSDQDFIDARKLLHIPMLRKDFMVDPFQFYEAKSMGADLVLLIAAILTKNEIQDFMGLSHDLGMEVLLEVHDEFELEESWVPGLDLVGVNNRNLKNFEVDIQTSFRLAGLIPESSTKISESGISNPETIHQLKNHGFKGFLIGETFMKKASPEKAIQDFVLEIQALEN